MFSKKKKKPLISMPSNFEHRVHTGFDKREQRYVGLPLQWASIVGNNQILKSTNRPLPLVDPSEITPTEILDLKTIVRPHHNNNKVDATSLNSSVAMQSAAAVGGVGNGPGGVGQHMHGFAGDNASISMTAVTGGGIVLPKTSHVARSNSLRSSSPPRIRRDLRGNANVPPAVPEESITSGTVNPMSGHLMNANAMAGYKSTQQLQQNAMPNAGTGGVNGPGMYGTQTTQNGFTGGGPLAVRTDFSIQPAASSLQFRQGTTHLHAQQTSPAGSVASNTRSTHSHISSHSHGHHMNHNNTTNLNNLPMYPSPQGQMHPPPALPPHGQHHHQLQQQMQMQNLTQQQQQTAKPLATGGTLMTTDQNQNPHHPHLHTKTASRASSSSGGASGIGATSATGGSTATAGQPKQEPRLTHEQVRFRIV